MPKCTFSTFFCNFPSAVLFKSALQFIRTPRGATVEMPRKIWFNGHIVCESIITYSNSKIRIYFFQVRSPMKKSVLSFLKVSIINHLSIKSTVWICHLSRYVRNFLRCTFKDKSSFFSLEMTRSHFSCRWLCRISLFPKIPVNALMDFFVKVQ